jgi:hypothetical protein
MVMSISISEAQITETQKKSIMCKLNISYINAEIGKFKRLKREYEVLRPKLIAGSAIKKDVDVKIKKLHNKILDKSIVLIMWKDKCRKYLTK